ncbi:MAG: ribonuclease Y [Verrucomicrobiia bacterium]|jgi:ribonuclease Y
MNLLADHIILIVVCLVIGVLTGVLCFYLFSKNSVKNAQREAKLLLENARHEADKIKKEVELRIAEEELKARANAERLIKQKLDELDGLRRRIEERESLVNKQLENICSRENEFKVKFEQLLKERQEIEEQRRKLGEIEREWRSKLENLAGLPIATIREQLMKEIEKEVAREAGAYIRRVVEQAKENAAEKARAILATALQRYAGEYTFESTTATITLPNDEIKGRIIGREGRNIRAFENATGVTVLIDETPNAVVLSGFDPVRREIAREAMSRLILDGRIHPTRIEEVVQKVQQEMDEAIIRHGENAVSRLGLSPMHPEILRMLGKLHYRQSYSQNLLEHSVEVGFIASLIAAEMGLDPVIAKKIGLLHDIGKAVNHEVEGPHAVVGAEVLRTYGESEIVINAVASHHNDVPAKGPYGPILGAADAISASRPGARSETLATYLKRVEDLERIGASFPGVEKCYAVQSGRELRVLVQPDIVSDDEAMALARNVAKKIEDELQYTGQIRVVVIRETRCIEYAK